MHESPEDILFNEDVAALYRTPVATVRYWRHRGTGPKSFKIGRRVAYLRADVQAWINAQREMGSA